MTPAPTNDELVFCYPSPASSGVDRLVQNRTNSDASSELASPNGKAPSPSYDGGAPDVPSHTNECHELKVAASQDYLGF